MSLLKHNVATRIVYPESDGKPMAEPELHRQLMVDLIEAFKNFFANQVDV